MANESTYAGIASLVANVYELALMTAQESLRKEWLDAYAGRLRQIEGEAPIDVGPY